MMEYARNTLSSRPNCCPECGHEFDLPPPPEWVAEKRHERLGANMAVRATKLVAFRPVPGRPDIVAYKLHIPPTGRESTITKMAKEKLEAKSKKEAGAKKKVRRSGSASKVKA